MRQTPREAQAFQLDFRSEQSALSASRTYSSTRRWLEFYMSQNLTAESRETTKKCPEYHLRFRYGTRSLDRFAQQKSFDLATCPKSECRNRINLRINLRKRQLCLCSSSRRLSTITFFFRFRSIIQRVPCEQHI